MKPQQIKGKQISNGKMEKRNETRRDETGKGKQNKEKEKEREL